MIDALFVVCYALSRLWLWERDVFRIEFWQALLLGKSSSSKCVCNDESCRESVAENDPLGSTSAHTSTSRRSFRDRHRSDPCMKRRSELRFAASTSSSFSGCHATRSSLPPSLMGCRKAIATCMQEQRHSFHACGNNSSSSIISRGSLLRTNSARSTDQPFSLSFTIEAEEGM